MTPEDREVISSLVFVPGRGRVGTPEDVLQHFEAVDGRVLCHRLLQDAVERQDGTDVELALVVCETFGHTEKDADLLLRLSSADWHVKHEDVVTAVGKLRIPAAVAALYHAAQWIPEYLEFDESRALATKAIRALGGIPGDEAEKALARLLDSDSEIVRQEAEAQLGRRMKSRGSASNPS